MRGPALALLLLAAVACGGGAPRGVVVASRPVLADPDAESRALALLERLVTTDPAGGVRDSLFAPGATIIADGRQRIAPPWLAGVVPAGSAAVTSARVSVRDAIAWAVVEYRWFAEDLSQARVGRATAVLVPGRDGGWRLDQLHSSSTR